MYSFYKHNLIIEKYRFLKVKKQKSYKIPTSDYKASCSQVVLRCKYCTREQRYLLSQVLKRKTSDVISVTVPKWSELISEGEFVFQSAETANRAEPGKLQFCL